MHCATSSVNMFVIGVFVVPYRGFTGMKEDRVMVDLSTRTAQEVLDDHLKLDEHFGPRKTGGVSSRRTSDATSRRTW